MMRGAQKRIALAARLVHAYAIPVGLAPSGSVAANGALTLGTALPAVYSVAASSGIWLRFPAGAAFSGSAAGLYYCIMSSTTAGTIYNNVLPSPGTPVAPATPTPIVAAGPGAYTATTASDIALLAVTIPAGLDVHGFIESFIKIACASSANNKQIKTLLDGALMQTSGNLTTVVGRDEYLVVQNRGALSSQLAGGDNAGIGTSCSGSHRMASINLSIDKVLTYTAQVAAAADFVIIESATVSATR